MTHFKLRVSLKKKELLVFCFSQVGVEGFYSVLQHQKMGRLEHSASKKRLQNIEESHLLWNNAKGNYRLDNVSNILQMNYSWDLTFF